MKDLISVIVPVYNSDKYLEECVSSIINQTYSNLEIILVNDGSKDNSGKICDEYTRKDKRIRVIHQENSGVSVARNNALSIMNGDYFSFVDSDDVIDKNYFFELYQALTSTNSDICICKTKDFTNSEILKSENKGVSKTVNLQTCKEEKITDIINNYYGSGAATKLYKNIYKNYHFENIKIGEDLLFNIDYMMKCTNVCILDYDGYFYRRSNDSVTKKIQKSLFYDLNELIKKRNFKEGIYKVYCFRLYNEQVFNIYKYDKKKLYHYIKMLDGYSELFNMLTNDVNVLIELIKAKKIYIRLVTFLIQKKQYFLVTILEKLKYKIKEIV